MKVKTSFPTKPLAGLAGHQRWGMEECAARLVQTFPDLQKNWSMTCLLTITFTETSHDRGFKTWQTPATYPECLLWKNVSVGGGLRRMPHGPQYFERNNWQGKGCRSVCRITINIAWPE